MLAKKYVEIHRAEIKQLSCVIFTHKFFDLSLFFSGDTVFMSGAASTPIDLAEAMTRHGKANNLKDITVCHMHTEGPASYAQPDCEGSFYTYSFC